MSVYDKNHYNIVISLQLIKINEKNMVFFLVYIPSVVPQMHMEQFDFVKHCFK